MLSRLHSTSFQSIEYRELTLFHIFILGLCIISSLL
nr:MAG TPA: hypothetical protein [Caudoviricetes sp.]